MADTNTTKEAISKVVETGSHIIDNLDVDLYHSIQPWLNKLYSGKYSEFFSANIMGIPMANLLAAILVFLFFLLLRKVFSRIVMALLLRLAQKTETRIDDLIIEQLQGPLSLLFVVLGLRIFFQLIFRETDLIKLLLDAATIYVIFWALYAITPAIKEVMYRYSRHNDHLSFELTNFLIRIIRILIIFFGFIAILYNFGVNVTAFFASLGIGGLALALAAKDTAANLFGSIALLIDRSVKVGEWIRVGDIEGTVEDIGMRTTKIRTFEKSLIAVPNSVVATSPIENYSRRGIRRIKMTIGLTYDTPRETLEAIVRDLRTMLDEHPSIAQDAYKLVFFRDFNASDLGILIYAFAAQSKWETYLSIRQSVNLEIMRIVERHGASFAFPSQSVYIESMPETADTPARTNTAPTEPKGVLSDEI